MSLDELRSSGASLSACELYRYALWRIWVGSRHKPLAVFIMLNPSTADGSVDDPTIRRCMAFARRLGCRGLIVINLFAFRATRPEDCERARDPVGPENDVCTRLVLLKAHTEGWPVLASWGAATWATDRAAIVGAWATELGVNLQCLGVTAAGAPRHPLYVKGDASLQLWAAPAPTQH